MYTYSNSFDFFNINAKETNSGIVTIEYNSVNVITILSENCFILVIGCPSTNLTRQ